MTAQTRMLFVAICFGIIALGTAGGVFLDHITRHPSPAIVAVHCTAEDDWGYVALVDYTPERVTLKCVDH